MIKESKYIKSQNYTLFLLKSKYFIENKNVLGLQN